MRGYLGIVTMTAGMLAGAVGLWLLASVLGFWFWLALFLVVPVFRTE